MKYNRAGKSMLNIMLKRSHGMNWLKGYIVAMDDILKKKDLAIEFALKGADIAHFMSAEAKAMQASAITKYDELERQFQNNATAVTGDIYCDDAPK